MSTPEAPDTGPPAAPAAAPSPRASAQTAKNMIWAILLCLVPIAAISFVVIRPHQPNVPTVDWQPILAQARPTAPYHLLGPDPLPTGWRATSARYGPAAETGGPTTWHLGVLTQDQKYVGLEQSNATASVFLGQQVGARQPDGTRTIGGAVWQQVVLTDRSDHEHALVRTTAGVTTLVEGTPTYDVLAGYVGVLR